jgi:hypothetical protein
MLQVASPVYGEKNVMIRYALKSWNFYGMSACS